MTRVSQAVGANTAVEGPPIATKSATPPSSEPIIGLPSTQPQPTQPVAPFHPPTVHRQKGLASRSWVPVALSFGTVIIVAIALVIYFSQHT